VSVIGIFKVVQGNMSITTDIAKVLIFTLYHIYVYVLKFLCTV